MIASHKNSVYNIVDHLFWLMIEVIYNEYETKYIFLGAHYNFILYASYENYYIENTGVYVEI